METQHNWTIIENGFTQINLKWNFTWSADSTGPVPRGGHQYVHCADTRDWDQNLTGPILGP